MPASGWSSAQACGRCALASAVLEAFGFRRCARPPDPPSRAAGTRRHRQHPGGRGWWTGARQAASGLAATCSIDLRPIDHRRLSAPAFCCGRPCQSGRRCQGQNCGESCCGGWAGPAECAAIVPCRPLPLAPSCHCSAWPCHASGLAREGHGWTACARYALELSTRPSAPRPHAPARPSVATNFAQRPLA